VSSSGIVSSRSIAVALAFPLSPSRQALLQALKLHRDFEQQRQAA